MKTRLLRRIRKECEILRVDRPSMGDSVSDLTEQSYARQFGLPFYLVTNGHFLCGRKSFSRCIDVILDHARKKYAHKMKKKRGKITKVWYNPG